MRSNWPSKLAKRPEYKEAYILSTLAAAYAETGDFETAIKWSTKAVEIGEAKDKDELQKELDSYKNKKPWRELKDEDAENAKLKESKPAAAENTAKKPDAAAPEHANEIALGPTLPSPSPGKADEDFSNEKRLPAFPGLFGATGRFCAENSIVRYRCWCCSSRSRAAASSALASTTSTSLRMSSGFAR